MKNLKQLYIPIIAILGFLQATAQPTPANGKKWEKVELLSDEFNANSLDRSKWQPTHPTWSGRSPSKYNSDNVSVSGGDLRLKSTVKNNEKQGDWVWASCVSSNSKAMKKGYYSEARVKCSKLSMTTAFWFQGSDHIEIDVIENFGAPSGSGQAKQNKYMKTNTHYFPGNNAPARSTPWDKEDLPVNVSDAYYTYGVWWKDSQTVIFYLNGEEVHTSTTKGDFNEDQRMFFDTEVFSWGIGHPTLESLRDNTKNVGFIDWVHTYKLVDGDGGGSTCDNVKTATLVEDAYLEGTSRKNTGELRVESGNRISYLKFTVPSTSEEITSTKLKLTVAGDIGDGLIEIFKGSSNNWTESNLSSSNKPAEGAKLGALNATYSAGQSYEWDLSGVTPGETISLIVKQTGGNDVSFSSKEGSSAPRLVLNIDCDDNTTNRAAADIENECDADYEEKNGLVVIEAENITTSGAEWNTKTEKSGFTGAGYLSWDGADSFGTPGKGKITAKIKINTPGKYRFQWRNRIGEGTNSTEFNDSWLKFPDASSFYGEKGTHKVYPKGSGSTPNPEGSGGNGWFKIFLSGTSDWTWSTNTSDNDSHQIYVEFDTAGVYTMEISGRSKEHLIDRMVLFNASNNSSALNLSNPETSCTGGGTNPGCNEEQKVSVSDDAYLQGSNSTNNGELRVESGNRVSYLKFTVPAITKEITSAKLELSVSTDAGNGLIEIFKGTSNSWTEVNLSSSNKPAEGAKLGSLNTAYSKGQSYLWDLTGVTAGETISLIVKQTGGNDVSFSSKEGSSAPKLVLGIKCDDDSASFAKKNKNIDTKTSLDLKMFPNPAKDIITVSGLNLGESVIIYDLLGKEVIKHISKNEKESINVSVLKSGLYVVSVAGKNNMKFIKE